MNAAGLTLRALTKRFGDVAAVDGLDLDVRPGELMVLVGPSGSGKSTVLRLVAGLEDPTAGTIEIAGRDVARKSARDRDVAMIFQDYALYPHMTCGQNIAYGLKVRGVPKAVAAQRVLSAARLLGIEELLGRRPDTLSGGQRQRVAMGRAIARHPALYLMDEPLSNLDARLRAHMRTELRALQQRLGVTTIFVTHDQVEAMTMGDRVAVLRAGQLQQHGEPGALYDRPANVFVAGFIGTPAMNFMLANIDGDDVRVGPARLNVRPPADMSDEAIIGIRPEGLILGGSRPLFTGQVRAVELLGNEAIVHLDIAARAPELPELKDAAVTSEALGPTRGMIRVTARVPKGTPLPAGGSVPLTMNPEAVHFFDVITHTALAPPQPNGPSSSHSDSAKRRD